MAIPTDLAQTAAQQLATAYVGLVEAMHDYFSANPTATQAQAAAHLNGLAYPDPTSPIQFTDRVALFQYLMNRVHPYDGQSTAYLSLRKLLIDHPKAFILKMDANASRPSVSVARRKLMEILGDINYDIETAPDAVQSITRSAKSSLVLVRECSSASLGYRVRVTKGITDLGTHEVYDGTEVIEEF